MTGPERRRSGSGKEIPPAAGKGGSAGAVQPGASASTLEGAPGQIILAGEAVLINAGREVTSLTVVNTADRPISVASHFHFAEANAALDFDRATAWGTRLNILAGSMLRFDPGASQEVELVPLAGRRVVRGLRGECGGALDD